jgi:signal transduction histidine kinase
VNLIGNAIKFTNAGGITVHITRNGKKKIKIDVTDTGIGISREDKAKLFKKFFQINKAEQARSGGSGTGLGLTIAKEIVKLHGGAIGIDSEPGKGTTFWFTLPLSQVQKKKKALLLAS